MQTKPELDVVTTRPLDYATRNHEFDTLRYLHLDVFTSNRFEGQPARGLPRPSGHSGGPDAADRRGDGLLGVHVHLWSVGAGRRADAHLHSRRGAADGGPPDDRQHIRHSRRKAEIQRGRDKFVFELGVGPIEVLARVERRKPGVRLDDAAPADVRPAGDQSRRDRGGPRRGSRQPPRRSAVSIGILRSALLLRCRCARAVRSMRSRSIGEAFTRALSAAGIESAASVRLHE